jgi:hypothetical protein
VRPLFTIASLAVLLAACGQAASIQAASNINGGLIAVSQAATYNYSLTWPECKNPNSPGTTSTPWFGLNTYRLVSDTGTTDNIALPESDGTQPNASTSPVTGQLYLTPGNWSGALLVVFPNLPVITEPCGWSLTLTPSQ